MTAASTSPGPVIRIRRVELADASLIEQYASDARIAETSHVPHPYPRGGGLSFAARAISAWKARSEFTFVVTENEALVGLVSVMAVNRLRASAQVGYWIGVPFWGRGIATMALRQAVNFAFDELHLVEVGAGCLAINLASARVLEKNGFIEQVPFNYSGPDVRFTGQLIRTFHLSVRAVPWR